MADEGTGMVGRVLGALVAVVALAAAVAGCATTVAGSPVAASAVAGGTGAVSQTPATQVCGAVPAVLVEQLFGVTSVQTTVASARTQQGIYQVQCLIAGSPKLTIHLVYAAAGAPYTPGSALVAIQRQPGISNARPITGVGAAQSAIQYDWRFEGAALTAVSAAEQAGAETHVYTAYMDAAAARGGTPLVTLVAALFR